MKDRIEHYLGELLQNPGQWVRVVCTKDHTKRKLDLAERERTCEGIKTALNVMGIEFVQNPNQHTKFKVLPHQDKERILQQEMAKQDFHDSLLKHGSATFISTPRQNGKSKLKAILDDATYDWKTSIWPTASEKKSTNAS